ncbi:MAG TPA: helix-turn-helix domain-containing protein [Anaerohalosphaeraceae bacterium]|nr:helix-turn-helix domain-containing protein [Anaerohalosphaeraceae bacterium]HOL87762.1 helix-turn-helix domain-containing protein [Anaerohalosphaeraceae bacterium]HPP55114.1 helix-turn-helix domain-containing protein [Anaerohalosphaeraceae bacterium]
MAKNKTNNVCKISSFLQRDLFDSIHERFRRHYGLGIETIGTDGRRIHGLCSDSCEPTFCSYIRKNPAARKRCLQERLRSLHMAFETGQPYTTLCHAGILFSCIPIMHRETPLGGMLTGKCLSEPFNETIGQDMLKRLAGLRFPAERLFDEARSLPITSGRLLHEAVEFLFILVYETAKLDPHVIEWKRRQTAQQAHIGELIQEHKQAGLEQGYPFELEKRLIAKVQLADKSAADDLLNTLLAGILYHYPGQVNILKIRLTELLGILSRAAAEAGADPETLLEKNASYISKVIALQSQEEICLWLSVAVRELIDCVSTAGKPSRLERLQPALEFLRQHFRERITLEQIARSAHLSVSRLCHLFQERMQTTAVAYLNELRIRWAKRLLSTTEKTCLEICYESGFENLSYFNRTFKKLTGLTPSQFRKQHRPVKSVPQG